LQIVYFYNTTF